MIHIVDETYANYFAPEMDAMFRSRAENFSNRLGWEVVVTSGYERDRFDDINPLYLISVDPRSGEYWGSLRLLPTTGPNMLQDVFPQLLGEEKPIVSATVWESSRICVSNRADSPLRLKRRLNYALCELLLGIAEVAIPAGLTNVVSVFDAKMLRILRSTALDLSIIGAPQRIGKAMSYAAMFEAGPDALARLQDDFGIAHSVLAPNMYEYRSLIGRRSTADDFAS